VLACFNHIASAIDSRAAFSLAKLPEIVLDSASMNPPIKIPIPLFPIALILALVCIIGLLPRAQALNPPPDGGYPGGNTAEGQSALSSLTSGTYNTAVGVFSLETDITGNFNTGIGAGTLLANTGGQNTATGAGALLSNATGAFNTANGAFALFQNTSFDNTAIGSDALENNTVGSDNTAAGYIALMANTTGSFNAAIGEFALGSNTSGSNNTAAGDGALASNTTGGFNTALGPGAGSNATTGSNNVYIGAGVMGVAGESDACYIASIFGQPSASGIPVLIGSDNKLGTTISSQRFKEEIKAMDKASEVLLALKPVTFRYKKEIDPARTSQFGLVAEDVEAVNPALVVHDKEGKPYSVRYDQVNAMLLNEFLKEHRKMEELQKDLRSTIAQQQKQIEALTAGLQKVSAQLEVSKAAPQTVLNNR
jgi:hypothetical protein